jgi:hypothetical protein
MRAIFAFLFTALLFAGPPAARKELLTVPFWVQAENGEAEAALTPKDLRVTVNGVAAAPVRLLGPGDDLMLLVVADMAGDLTLAQEAKSALSERLQQLPPKAAVGLLKAQDGVLVLVDPTADRALVTAAIESLPVSGRAGLLETVQTVARIGDSVLSKAAVRVAVLYVSDSEVTNYREDFSNPVINYSDSGDMSRRFRDGLIRERISKLETALAGVKTPVFILHLAYRNDELNMAYQTGLMRLAATTGGTSFFCRSQTEIPDAMQKIFDTIASHYSVRVRLPASAPSSLEVTLESPGRSLNYRDRFLSGEK